MYNRYSQSNLNSNYNRLSTGFIKETSPNRFRNTLVGSQFSEIPSINRLRSSFSSATIQYFDQITTQPQPKYQNRQSLYTSLKNTLNQLQTKIKFTKKSLTNQYVQKKKNKQKQSYRNQTKTENQKYPEIQQYADKHRQTMSTQITSLCIAKTKISQFINSQPKPTNFHQFFTNPYDSKKFNLYYVSEAIRASNQKNSLAMQHINGSIKMIKSCADYYNPNFNNNTVFKMQRHPKNMNKKTLVLDLDQTLIHCYQNLEVQTDIKLTMNIQNLKIEVGVNIRPYAMTFLKRMAKKFQIVIFTASHQAYANTILDQLDPTNQIFSHRFYRHHCIVLPNQLHVKDLRYLDRDLKDVVLVDNAAYSYSFQVENGIPILPYYEGKDYQLPVLQSYLQRLAQSEDVRQLNREFFKLQQYKHYETAEELIRSLYAGYAK